MFVQHLGLLAALFAVAQAKVQYLVGPPFLRGSGKTWPTDLKPQGIAIAGIDFGCDIDVGWQHHLSIATSTWKVPIELALICKFCSSRAHVL